MDQIITPVRNNQNLLTGILITAADPLLSLPPPFSSETLQKAALRMLNRTQLCDPEELKLRLSAAEIYIRNKEEFLLLEKDLGCRLIECCRNISFLDEYADSVPAGEVLHLIGEPAGKKNTKDVADYLLKFFYGGSPFIPDNVKKWRRSRTAFFEQYSIRSLYHITARSNLDSIYRHGGLFSWHYNRLVGIRYAGGGNSFSNDLDRRNNMQDWVRLSFCQTHPMYWRLHKDGSGPLIVLKIAPEVLLQQDCRFSDMNATKKDCCISEDIRIVNMDVILSGNYHDPRFQAEVLIPRHIHLDYITGITDFKL
jgi:hypothetical protein